MCVMSLHIPNNHIRAIKGSFKDLTWQNNYNLEFRKSFSEVEGVKRATDKGKTSFKKNVKVHGAPGWHNG